MIHSAIFSVALLAATMSEIPNFDRVLLPMHDGDARGASGSVWKVDEVIVNGSEEDVTVYPYFFMGSWFEATVWSLPPGKRLLGVEITQPIGCRNVCSPPHPGTLLYVKSDEVDRLVMYDRVYEANVDKDNHGAVIPAVHESRFRKGRTTFPAIPMSSDFRSTLRLYNLTLAPQEFSVRVVSTTKGEDLVLAAVTLTVPAAYGVPSFSPLYEVPLRPGYNQVPIEALLSSLPADGTVRLLVDGASDAEYWAFVSVTSNRASRVTVFVP